MFTGLVSTQESIWEFIIWTRVPAHEQKLILEHMTLNLFSIFIESLYAGYIFISLLLC